MTPKVKQSAINVSALLGAVVAVSGLMTPLARTVDARYVKTSTYSSDSINRYYQDKKIGERLAKLDTMAANLDTLKVCIRNPHDRGCGR